jgi:tetratricopeptide (TPR) repeat protein
MRMAHVQLRVLLLSALGGLAGGGCAPSHQSLAAAGAPYYNYQFTAAREILREPAETQVDENIILNHVRLGLAAMADGDRQEAERTLGRAFEYMSTAGLNRDRTTAAILLHEGVKIFKGEPFEQALTYYWVSALYATLGDWENARAAAANSLFRLTEFIGDPRIGRADGSRPPDGRDYTVVDTNFALGFLMQAIASELSNAPGMNEQLDAALEINPKLEPIVRTLRSGSYDTLLIVDFGKGPIKIAYGPDQSLVRWMPQVQAPAYMSVSANGREVTRAVPVCDVNAMAEDLRWNDLENVRKAKSAVGNVLVTGGFIAAAAGAQHGSGEAVIAGLGAMAAGLLTKSGAQADTRHIDFAPQYVFIVPVHVGEASTLSIKVHGSDVTEIVLPDFAPGTFGEPRAIYLRLHGPNAPQPAWLTATDLMYSNDATGVQPGDLPWILGGRDVSSPTRAVLEAYQASGCLRNLTTNDLLELYAAEDMLMGSGAEMRPDRLRNPSYRHILEGGTGLFTPMEHSLGYKRLMFTPRAGYAPKSDRARALKNELEGLESHSEN